MTAYASLRASWGSRQGCEMCFECRTGGQGLKTNWLESVQRTAAWFSGKPVSETVLVCRSLGAALCQPSPNILLLGAAHLSSRDMWCCTGCRCVGRWWILKHPLWSSRLGCRCYLGTIPAPGGCSLLLMDLQGQVPSPGQCLSLGMECPFPSV